MSDPILLEYNRPLLKKAVNFYYWKLTGFVFFVALDTVLILFIMTFSLQSWLTGFLGAISLLGILFSIVSYMVIYNGAMKKLSAMETQQGSLSMTEDNFTLSSDIGQSTVPWETIKNIWKSKEFWVIQFDRGGGYFTLPLKNLTPHDKEFFLSHVQNSKQKD